MLLFLRTMALLSLSDPVLDASDAVLDEFWLREFAVRVLLRFPRDDPWSPEFAAKSADLLAMLRDRFVHRRLYAKHVLEHARDLVLFDVPHLTPDAIRVTPPGPGSCRPRAGRHPREGHLRRGG